MKRVFSILCLCAGFFCAGIGVCAQTLTFSKVSHDFGQVTLGSGPVQCTFEAVNNSSQSAVIRSVTTSCGCTNVQWQHEPIAPGARTTISASYSNDEGPFPFDKVLTVKVVGEEKPILLHLRGRSVKEVLPDSEVYTNVFGGSMGLESVEFKLGNIEQGLSRGEQATVANLSSKPVKVTFADVTPGLTMSLSPNPIPAGAHATLTMTVQTSSDRWGTNTYSAKPVVGGVKSDKAITVQALTCTKFSTLSREQKSAGSRPLFEESTFSFGHKKQGTRVEGSFSCRNAGKSTLTIYKVESDNPTGLKAQTMADVPAQGSGSFAFTLDTSAMPKGEALVIVTLVTNSPLRPVVNLFITGWID